MYVSEAQNYAAVGMKDPEVNDAGEDARHAWASCALHGYLLFLQIMGGTQIDAIGLPFSLPTTLRVDNIPSCSNQAIIALCVPVFSGLSVHSACKQYPPYDAYLNASC